MNQNEPSSSGSQLARDFTGSQFLDIPSSPPAEAADISSSNSHIPLPLDAHYMPDSVTHYESIQGDFRSSSAQSHSASEYSYSSTDIDSNMSDTSSLFNGHNDQIQGINFDGMNMGAGPSNQYWQPRSDPNGQTGPNGGPVKAESPWDDIQTVAPDSVSPADITSSVGPIRGNSADQSARLSKLERK